MSNPVADEREDAPPFLSLVRLAQEITSPPRTTIHKSSRDKWIDLLVLAVPFGIVLIAIAFVASRSSCPKAIASIYYAVMTIAAFVVFGVASLWRANATLLRDICSTAAAQAPADLSMIRKLQAYPADELAVLRKGYERAYTGAVERILILHLPDFPKVGIFIGGYLLSRLPTIVHALDGLIVPFLLPLAFIAPFAWLAGLSIRLKKSRIQRLLDLLDAAIEARRKQNEEVQSNGIVAI